MNIEKAKEILKGCEGDSESYHSKFDDILEARLMELDPEFMTEMTKMYEESGASRWYT